jgi:hypothetical protein
MAGPLAYAPGPGLIQALQCGAARSQRSSIRPRVPYLALQKDIAIGVPKATGFRNEALPYDL